MASTSLTQQARELETRISVILSSFDVDSLLPAERELIALIKRQTTDARLDVRDYEYADTRAEQLARRTEAKKRFETVQQYILKASENNFFSAIDVAQLSAQIQQLISNME